MLNGVQSMFDNMGPMMKKLKKRNYEANMKQFREEYGRYFQEMTDYVESAEEKDKAAAELAAAFAGQVKEAFQSPKNGKIKPYIQTDLNFFAIYYVFPALLLTEHEDAERIADAILEAWGNTFEDSKIKYTDYDTLYGSFREKIFGIF